MPKEISSIASTVMNRIHHEKIKIRPKIFYLFGSLLLFVGFIASILTSIFLFGLIRFSLRTHGPMGEYRFAKMITYFPWWAVITALIGLIVGIWLLRKFDFSYRLNKHVVIIGFITAIVLAGWLVDLLGFNTILFRRNQFQKMFNAPFQERTSQHPFNPNRF